jgi:hypothetical protein
MRRRIHELADKHKVFGEATVSNHETNEVEGLFQKFKRMPGEQLDNSVGCGQ